MSMLAASAIVGLLKLIRENYRRIDEFNDRADSFVQYLDVVESILSDFYVEEMDALLRNTLENLCKVVTNANQVFLRILREKEDSAPAKKASGKPLRKKLVQRMSNVMRKAETFMYPKECIDALDFQRREIESYVQLLQLNVSKTLAQPSPNTSDLIIDDTAEEDPTKSPEEDHPLEQPSDSDSGSSATTASVDIQYMLSLAARKHAEFLPDTRQWVLDHIIHFAQAGEQQVFLLVAAAGLGKSVVLAELCARGGALDKVIKLPAAQKEKEFEVVVGAAHFFVYSHNVFADAACAIESISFQLAQRLPGFRPARARTGSSASDNSDLHTLFYDSVLAPLSDFQVSPLGKPLLIVLDALDECAPAQREQFVSVLMGCMQGDLQLPSWVKLVVSTRPQKAQKQLEMLREDVCTHVLQPTDELNMNDIQVFFEAKLAGRLADSAGEGALKTLSEELARRSEGLFLYAKLVERSTRQLEGITLDLLEDEAMFPKGIHRYYRSYFSRVLSHGDFAASFPNKRKDIFRAIFSALYYAFESIPPEVVQGVAGYEDQAAFQREILFVIDELVIHKPDGTMTLLHRSLGDFLHTAQRDKHGVLPCISAETGNEVLTNWCMAHLNHGYSRRNVLSHLQKAERQEDCDSLLMNVDWLCDVVAAEGITKLAKDARKTAQQEAATHVAQALSLSSYAVKSYPEQLGVQMWSRLPITHALSSAFYKKMHQGPAVLPIRFRTYLTSVESALIHLLRGHSSPVISAACSPDGAYVASCSIDTSVWIWSVQTGAEVLPLRGHEESVWCCCFSTDSGTLASGSKDTTIKLWTVPEGELLATLSGHSSGVERVRFGPNNDFLASVGATTEGLVRVWALAGSSAHSQLFQVAGSSFSFLLSSAAIIVGTDTGAKVIDLSQTLETSEPQEMGEMSNGDAGTLSLEVSPHGNSVACVTGEEVVLQSLTQSSDLKVQLNWPGMKSVEWAPDGRYLAAWSLTSVRMWDIEEKVEQFTWDANYGRCTAFAFANDSETFALGFFKGHIILYSTSTGEVNVELPGHLLCVTWVGFTKSGALVSASRDNNLRIWKLHEQAHSVVKGHRDKIHSVVLSPKGDVVASCAADSTIKLWSTEAGTETVEFIHDRVVHVVFSPDSCWLVSFGEYGSDVKIWSLDTFELNKTLQGYQSVEISPDSSKLATYVWEGYKGKIDIWDLQTGEKVHQLAAHNNGYTIRFSPDGELIGSCAMNMRDPMAYNDETVMIWNVKSGEMKHMLSTKAKSLQFSRDGTLFATYQFRSGVTIWSARSGRQLHFLKNHGENFGFSQDSSLLVTTNGADVKEVVVYDIRNGMTEIERCRHSSDLGQTLLRLHVRNRDGSYPWKGYNKKGTIYVDKGNVTEASLTFDVGIHEPPSVDSVVKARDLGARTVIYGALKNNDVFILEYSTRRKNVGEESD